MRQDTRVVRLHQAGDPLALHGTVRGWYGEDEVMVSWDDQEGIDFEWADELVPVREEVNDGSQLVSGGAD